MLNASPNLRSRGHYDPLPLHGEPHSPETVVSVDKDMASSHDIVIVDLKPKRSMSDSEPALAKKSPPPPPTKPKILFLDGLRGLAAMMAVTQHSSFISASVGQPAVDTFFVLSAFLLTMIFEKKAQTLMRENASFYRWGLALVDYFVRRFLRVYPLFALTAIFLSTRSPELLKNMWYVNPPESFDLWKVLTFKMGYRYFVFWTLPLEITYYFIIPVLVIGVLKLGKYWWAAVGPMWIYVLYEGCTGFRWYAQGFAPHFPTFLCGSLTAFVYTRAVEYNRTHHNGEFNLWKRLLLRAVEMLSLVIMLSVIFDGLLFKWLPINPIPQTNGARFVHANIAVILFAEMLLPGAISSVLEWSLLRYAGKISFSMYLLHVFVVRANWIYYQTTYERFFLIWSLVFLLAAVSYQVVEHPCQEMTTRIGAALKARDAVAAAKERATSGLPAVISSKDPAQESARAH